jgi:hypothetical protein
VWTANELVWYERGLRHSTSVREVGWPATWPHPNSSERYTKGRKIYIKMGGQERSKLLKFTNIGTSLYKYFGLMAIKKIVERFRGNGSVKPTAHESFICYIVKQNRLVHSIIVYLFYLTFVCSSSSPGHVSATTFPLSRGVTPNYIRQCTLQCEL